MAAQQVLLDTNIFSELGKPEPQESVVEFVSGLSVAWISTITLHELEYGMALLPEGNRRRVIEKSLAGLIEGYSDYIIAVGHQEARQAALFRAARRSMGQPLSLADSLIAGTAGVHGLCVATRNIKDFVGLGVELVDPFSP